MIPESLAPIANHLWQSTVFVGMAGLLTLAMRKNRAQTRYWLWLAASIKFLIPFSLLVDVGGHWGQHAAPAVTPPALSYAIEQASQPFSAPTPLATATAGPQIFFVDWVPALLCAIWAIGFATFIRCWWRRWRGLRAALRTASPADLQINLQIGMEAMISPAFAEPGVFGVRRPVLLLPDGITDSLTPQQLKAIVTHELCHVRRRDNLATAIHMAVEALFWFHPLVWWLGARLIEERERACDEEVLLMGSEPEAYARGILKICELYLESPLSCVSGVTGGSLKKRIEEIMAKRIGLRLSVARKISLAAVGVTVLVVPILIGVVNPPVIRAQAVPAGTPKQTVENKPSFEVATVKPSVAADNRITIRVQPGGRYTVANATLKMVITTAYGIRDYQISGGPSWIGTDRWNIEAKAEEGSIPARAGPPDPSVPDKMMLMVLSLLEDRFQLKTHREVREAPVYELVVGKTGTKMKLSDDQQPVVFSPDLPQGDGPPRGLMRLNPAAGILEGKAVPVPQLAQIVSEQAIVGRPVIDKTELKGLYDFKLEWTPEQLQPGVEPLPPSPDVSGPSIFTAIQEQLGLKLESAKGPVEFLIIDHAEKPSEN